MQSDVLAHMPRFDEADAARLASAFRGGITAVRRLDSERDQNFRVDSDEGPFVLKIANALESGSFVECQIRALAHIEPGFDRSPRVIPALDGASTLIADGADGHRHAVWAVSLMPGIPLSAARWRSPALFERIGRAAGGLTRALRGFDHEQLHREFLWDAAHGPDTIDRLRPLVADAAVGPCIDDAMSRIRVDTVPRFGALRRGVIHNDLNDNNILVGGDGDPFSRNQEITGIIDFGDIIHGFVAGEVAVACAYAALDAADPLAVCARVVAGYHSMFPLTDDELGAIFGLVLLRLCTSVCIAAKQQREQPTNAYLGVSQAPIRRTLPILTRTPFGLAEAVLRDGCGLDPVPRSGRVKSWLGSIRAGLAPVLDDDPRTEPIAVIAMDPASELMSCVPRENAERPLTQRIDAAMRAAGARIGVGLWDEPRLLYDGAASFEGAVGDEPRNIHLGIDLFAPPGSPVYAPLAGTVHDLGDNASPGDYGPVIMLRHETPDGDAFFSLYGHLARESLRAWSIGRPVAAGERIGWIGDATVNGGWTPHVHIQLIVDDRAVNRGYPGVGRASRREAWRALCPDPNLIVGVPASTLPAPRPALSRTLDTRHRLLGRNLSIGYRTPVRVVRGWMQYLWDDTARRFVDGYNNVPHVGHAHPRVVEAARRQMSLVSTNTRYLNDQLGEYAGRLVETLPPQLRVCWFVNSGSEANELAIRLARSFTGARDVIVLENAYHGNTGVAIDISPYKHAGPGGAGAPPWVHVATVPDDYRGEFRREDPFRGVKFAAHVGTILGSLAAEDRRPCAFIAETCPSVGGQIVPPPGYFADVYRRVRAAGGVCIADEVQTGFGRIGTHFWAFEAHDVIPDIVVLGKPMGNGYPIGAVITTREIADAFDNGMEFFSTFGGSTVSAAVGLAVLDVLRDENLQQHARLVGDRLLDGLRELMHDHALVGDVRGAGLFTGAELVTDRDTRAPATGEAAFVVERLRDRGVLIGTDGPFHNVLKIRPPMPFNAADADRLIDTIDSVLRMQSWTHVSGIFDRDFRSA